MFVLPASAVLAGIALALPAVGQITPDALRARTQLERQQRTEETVQRMRDTQRMQDATTRGGDPSRIGTFGDQWAERAAEERRNSEQRLRMQSGAAQTSTSPEIELLRMQAERDAMRQAGDPARPTWGPTLDPVPPARGPVAPGVAR
jgi:hypothetical protein